MRVVRAMVVAALLLAACGGSDDTATTVAGGDDDGTTTTTTAPDDDGGGESIDIGDIPEECLDALGDMLRAIEPEVEGFDFENATTADLETLAPALEAATAEYEETIVGSGCDELDVDATDEESFEFMIDFAEDEAPGTVAYLEWIRDLAAGFGDGEGGGSASGDCEQDIAALMEFVNRDGDMGDLPMTELATVGELMTSISSTCSAERFEEFFSDPEVSEFLESS